VCIPVFRVTFREANDMDIIYHTVYGIWIWSFDNRYSYPSSARQRQKSISRFDVRCDGCMDQSIEQSTPAAMARAAPRHHDKGGRRARRGTDAQKEDSATGYPLRLNSGPFFIPSNRCC
jgi:hypothetical protein